MQWEVIPHSVPLGRLLSSVNDVITPRNVTPVALSQDHQVPTVGTDEDTSTSVITIFAYIALLMLLYFIAMWCQKRHERIAEENRHYTLGECSYGVLKSGAGDYRTTRGGSRRGKRTVHFVESSQSGSRSYLGPEWQGCEKPSSLWSEHEISKSSFCEEHHQHLVDGDCSHGDCSPNSSSIHSTTPDVMVAPGFLQGSLGVSLLLPPPRMVDPMTSFEGSEKCSRYTDSECSDHSRMV